MLIARDECGIMPMSPGSSLDFAKEGMLNVEPDP